MAMGEETCWEAARLTQATHHDHANTLCLPEQLMAKRHRAITGFGGLHTRRDVGHKKGAAN